jgi:hypothetical protein
VDNLHGVLDDADGHDLLTVVAAVHHERVGEALNDGALRLAEALLGVPPSCVRQVGRVLRRRHRQVVGQRDVLHLQTNRKIAVKSNASSCRGISKQREDSFAYVDIFEGPAVEELHRLLLRLLHIRHGRDRENDALMRLGAAAAESEETVEMAGVRGFNKGGHSS